MTVASENSVVAGVAVARGFQTNAQGCGSAEIRRCALGHRVYTGFDEVRGLRGQWDAFVESAGGDFFSSFDWCELWWRYYGRGRKLQIHLVREGERLVGIVPLFTERIRIGPLSVRAVRLVGCDHSVTTCAPVIERGRLAEVMGLVAEHLGRGPRWDLLHFGPLPGYFDSAEALADSLRGRPGFSGVDVRQLHPHMNFALPNSYERYVEKLSSSGRRNVRYDERKIEQMGTVRRSCVTEGAEVDAAYSRFVEMHQKYWVGRGSLGHFRDWPDAECFHRGMARRQLALGRLMLVELRLDEQVVACEYCYRFGRRVHWILTARRPDVPGRAGFCALVRLAIEAGATQIDAMKGFYEYKRLLGAEVTPQKAVVAYRRGGLAGVRAGLFLRAARVLDLGYYRLWFSRLVPRIPRWQRPLWRVWIRSNF